MTQSFKKFRSKHNLLPTVSATNKMITSILNYLSLISYATKDLADSSSGNPSQKPWLKDLVALLKSINVTSQEITSILALLSASVSNGTSLPPYLRSPTSYELTEKLEALDADILGINHIAEPGYAAFAVMQMASSLVNDDMGKLIKFVLVFHCSLLPFDGRVEILLQLLMIIG